MLRLLSSAGATLLAALLLAAPAGAAEPPPKAGLIGAIELKGTNGFGAFGLLSTDGRGGGALELFVGKKGEGATYLVRGEATTESAHFDLGKLGEIDLTAEKTGQMETVKPECGKPVKVERIEFVGRIDFHGEEGFTDIEATRTPLRWKTALSIVCGGVSSTSEWGAGLPGAELTVKRKNGPTLKLEQNHPGARVLYDAKETEMEGHVRVRRSVSGRLGGGALTFSPSLAAASFNAGGPFSGAASYAANGTWRGNLRVDFPGDANVPLAGPGFKASIRRTIHRGSFL